MKFDGQIGVKYCKDVVDTDTDPDPDNDNRSIEEFEENEIPILKIKKSEHGTYRIMFPLVIAHATTVHKSQGLTLGNVVLDLGPSEDTPGLTFVGISRVKKLHNLIIKNLNQSRIKGLFRDTAEKFKYSSLMERLRECKRLEKLADEWISTKNKK